MNIINGIKIQTDTTLTSDTYGLYATTGNSEFRFSECAVTGLPETWKDGFITRRGINKGSRKFDLLETGNTMQSTDITIRLLNTSQLIFFLESNSISLYKCILSIYEFVGTDSDADSIAYKKEITRSIEDIKFTETEIILKCKVNLAMSRNTVLSIPLDNVTYPYVPESNKDKRIPMIFGSSDPINGRYFKIMRTNAKNIDVTNAVIRFLAVESNIPTIVPNYLSRFPVSENAATSLVAKFKLGVYASSVYTSLWAEDKFIGLYIKVAKGVSEIEGVYRKILSSNVSSVVPPDFPLLEEITLDCQLDNYMEVPVVGNATSNATDQCWIEIYDLANEYKYTDYSIGGFFDSRTGLVLSDYPELFSKDNEGMIPILETGCDLAIHNNTITFNPMLFEGAIDNIKSFKILPISSIAQYTNPNLDLLGLTGFNTLKTQSVGVEGTDVIGYYKNPTIPLRANASASIFNNPSYCNDKNYATYTNMAVNDIVSNGNVTVYGVVEIELPDIPDNLIFTKCYLGLDIDIDLGYTTGNAPVEEKMYFSKRGYYGNAVLTEKTFGGGGGIWTWSSVRNFPDFYYQDIEEQNYNFLVSVDGQHTKGYKTIDIDVGNVNEYRNIYKVALIIGMRFPGSASGGKIDIKYNECAVIFECEQSIGTELFV